jgi:hypothetical protein
MDRCYFRSRANVTAARYLLGNIAGLALMTNLILASAKSSSTPANEQQKMWETYYGAFNKMEPHGNLQLHPNHPAVYSVSDSRVKLTGWPFSLFQC